MLAYVPKARLIELMVEWGAGRISDEEMSSWCCNNYYPGSQGFDPSAPRWQQNAIQDVLQAFEWQANDCRITARRQNWFKAVQFLNCSEGSYEENKRAFERDCAGFD